MTTNVSNIMRFRVSKQCGIGSEEHDRMKFRTIEPLRPLIERSVECEIRVSVTSEFKQALIAPGGKSLFRTCLQADDASILLDAANRRIVFLYFRFESNSSCNNEMKNNEESFLRQSMIRTERQASCFHERPKVLDPGK